MSLGITYVLAAAVLCWVRFTKGIELTLYGLYSLALGVGVSAYSKADSDIAVYQSIYEQFAHGYAAYNYDHAFWLLLYAAKIAGLGFESTYILLVAGANFALMTVARVFTGRPGAGFVFACLFLALPVGVLLPNNLLRQYTAAAVCIPAILFMKRPWIALPAFNLHFSSAVLFSYVSATVFYGILIFVVFAGVVVSVLDLEWVYTKIGRLAEHEADYVNLLLSMAVSVAAIEVLRRVYGEETWLAYTRVALVSVVFLALDPYIAYRVVFYSTTLACILLTKSGSTHYLILGSLLAAALVHTHSTTIAFWGALF